MRFEKMKMGRACGLAAFLAVVVLATVACGGGGSGGGGQSSVTGMPGF